jgi:hypothetical protein
MTVQVYNPFIPQPPDLPSDSQPDMDSNFFSLNTIFGVDHIPFGNLIEQATLANPIVVTSTNHRLTTGNTVTIFNLEGTTPAGAREEWPINGNSFVVTVIDANTFSLNGSDSTSYPEYLPNSGDFSSVSLPYGQHTKTFLNSPPLNPPNRAAPRSAYFSQDIQNLAQLFYQNNPTAADIYQLTNLQFVNQTANGWGFRTPWGLKINMGQVVAFTVNFTTYDLPLPFTTTPIAIIATRGFIRQQTGTGTKSISAVLNSNSTFQIRYSQNSGGDGSAYADYLAIGI